MINQIDPGLLAIAATLIPMITAVITKRYAHSGIKAVTTLALSALAGGVNVALANNGQVVLDTWLWGMLSTWLASVGVYVGILRPSQVTVKLQEKTAGFGVG